MTFEKRFSEIIMNELDLGYPDLNELPDELFDDVFFIEFEKSFQDCIKKLKDRKFKNRGTPPKDTSRCCDCSSPIYHPLEGWQNCWLEGDGMQCGICYKKSKLRGAKA